MSRPDRRERRRAAEAKRNQPEQPLDVRGRDSTSSGLHEERIEAVMRALTECGARSVLDLGCGSGALVRRLLKDPRITRIVGIDQSAMALHRAEQLVALEHPHAADRIAFVHGSLIEPPDLGGGFDAATLVEVIEHFEPRHLSALERVVFEALGPAMVITTTPNHEYNLLYGMAAGEYRHADHRFEWTRPKFRRWAAGVAERNGYAVRFEDVGPLDPVHGGPTQLAAFTSS